MLKISQYFLYIYLLLKPYYLFSSGGIQVCDIFLIASFATLVIPAITRQKARKQIRTVVAENRWFIVFVLMTVLVNLVYFGRFAEFKFILSSLYFVYNLMAVILFGIYFKSRKFLLGIDSIFKLNLVLQLLVLLGGVGRIYSEGRYMGTFNDPNQFGYYILLSYMFIYLIKVITGHTRKELPYALIALFLILQSASTGMLMAAGIFVVLRVLINYRKILRLNARRIIIAALTICTAFVLGSLFFLYSNNGRTTVKLPTTELFNSQVGFISSRLENKTATSDTSSNSAILADRCIDMVTNHPEGIILGVGEGRFDRFESEKCENAEIHSTWISILFYYGMLPFLMLSTWVVSKIKTMNRYTLIAIIALFFESLTLINQRQTMFWAIILLASLAATMSKKAAKKGKTPRENLALKGAVA